MKRFAFLDRLTGDKNKNAQSDFDKQIAAIRSGDAESVECNETFTDDNIADICLAVQSSETVTSFRVRNVSIEPSIEFIASLCSTTKRLTELRLSNAGINEHEANCLIAALLNNKSLRLLAVDHNNITSSEQWAQLLKINKTLESLDLSHNHLCTVKGSDGAMLQIGESLVGNTKLRDLYLTGNGFQESSVKKFLKLIRENGDDVGLRSLDLVNDSSLSQAVRDEVSSVMARPWIGGGSKVDGLKKPREAADSDNNINTTTTTNIVAPPTASTLQKHNNNNNANHHSDPVTNNNNNTCNNSDDGDISVSNLSMTHIEDVIKNNNTNIESNNNNQNLTAEQQQLRAAKLQKLQQMKSKHQSEIHKKEQTEKELRENISQLQTLVERLKKDVSTAQEAMTLAVSQQQQQAAQAAAAADSSASSEQQQQSIFEEKEKQSQKQIQKLTSLLDEMAKRHSEEMEEQDRKLAQQQKNHQEKYEHLSTVVATLTAENEQGDVQISNIKSDMDNAKKNFDKEIERMKKVHEEKETELAAKFDQDREQYINNANRLQSQFNAANERAEELVQANHKLEEEASQQISTLRTQLEVAIASSTRPIAGFFDDSVIVGGEEGQQQNNNGDDNNNNNLVVITNQASTVVKMDAISQTEPLPTFSSKPNMSGTNSSSAPPIPNMDISSVTRFKMPDNGIPKPSSDDSFIGDSDDEDGGVPSLPGGGGKPKYLPKNKWIPDEKVNECRACKSKFGVFLRKHHCRMCGHVFCDDCAPVNKFDKQRVCHMCASSQHSTLFVA